MCIFRKDSFQLHFNLKLIALPCLLSLRILRSNRRKCTTSVDRPFNFLCLFANLYFEIYSLYFQENCQRKLLFTKSSSSVCANTLLDWCKHSRSMEEFIFDVKVFIRKQEAKYFRCFYEFVLRMIFCSAILH